MRPTTLRRIPRALVLALLGIALTLPMEGPADAKKKTVFAGKIRIGKPDLMCPQRDKHRGRTVVDVRVRYSGVKATARGGFKKA